MTFCSKNLLLYYKIQLNPFITNTSVRPKASFRYNRSIYKEIYAIGENDMIRYKRELVITEFFINGFNCIVFF
jgi:hypothetical protein